MSPHHISNKIFAREPLEKIYGTVAVFEDLYGNLWDLMQRKYSDYQKKKTYEVFKTS